MKKARTYQAQLLSNHNDLCESAVVDVSHEGRPEFIIFDGKLYRNPKRGCSYYPVPSCVVASAATVIGPLLSSPQDQADYVPSPERSIQVVRRSEPATAERLEEDAVVWSGRNAQSFSQRGKKGDWVVTPANAAGRRVYSDEQFTATYQRLD